MFLYLHLFEETSKVSPFFYRSGGEMADTLA